MSDITKDEKEGNWPISIDVPVLWGDMDAFGHVNNIIYLKWLETARMVYLNEAGLDKLMLENNIGVVLARTEIDYTHPLYFPDKVEIQVRVTKVGNTSFTMKYRLFSKTHDMQLVAMSDTVMVLYDYNKKEKTKISDELKTKLLNVK